MINRPYHGINDKKYSPRKAFFHYIAGIVCILAILVAILVIFSVQPHSTMSTNHKLETK